MYMAKYKFLCQLLRAYANISQKNHKFTKLNNLLPNWIPTETKYFFFKCSFLKSVTAKILNEQWQIYLKFEFFIEYYNM